jgi:hypothetical protein
MTFNLSNAFKKIYKTILTALFLCGITHTSQAQIGYDYAKYDFGIGASLNQVYGDAETIPTTRAYHANFNYNQTPFINYIVEFQFGKLAGGDSIKNLSGRQFSNNFKSLAFRAQLQAGEFVDYSQSGFMNILKNFYAGAGIGIIYNNMTEVSRYSTLLPGFYTPGKAKSNNLFLPGRVGYELKIFNNYNEPYIKIDLAYQFNFVLGDDIDGYKVSRNDVFNQYSIGVKFALGNVLSYRKQIHY